MERLILACGVVGFMVSSCALGAKAIDKEGFMWAPCVEWTVENPSWEGNPFDVGGSVTFRHEQTGQTHTTGMFYVGEQTWKFRFSGTRTGAWQFTTSSDDPDLAGLAGTVRIHPNPDPKIRGFLTHRGNRFALQVGNDAHLEGYIFTAFMDGTRFSRTEFGQWDEKMVQTYCDAALECGFETLFIHVNNQWFKAGTLSWDQHDSENPDLNTFAALERIITTAHRRGCRVHIWAWGDEQRKWTPIGVGGINGPADRRLQRYIAARLGPLPGWSMGYGFDLHEWTKPQQVNAWAVFMHEQLGWQHLLCARGLPLGGPDNINSYDGFGRDVPLKTTRHGPRDYAEIAEDIDGDTDRPHLYEERHSYLRKGFSLDMDGTRRLLWWEAMAGGMGGFFGFYPKSSSAFVQHPYPNPEQLRTHRTFWQARGRFLLDMKRANELSDSGANVLRDGPGEHYVAYQQDTDAIVLDLSGMPGAQPALAVDTKQEYHPIDLGRIKPGKQSLALPSMSDWAVAIGRFGPPDASRQGLGIENGWLVHNGRAVWGWIQHNGWWRPGQRANITRRSVGDPQGDIRPNRTEDLDRLTDAMLTFGYPGFEHNYGLWYDRRRDAHDVAPRADANAHPPFLEQPWARSATGQSSDGLPKYDLTTFNSWYFNRLEQFAQLCDAKGTVLLHKYHMQHALLEAQTHYVDFPWRPANCIQDTGMPDAIPAANAFYDISHPVRRQLHQVYIQRCLESLGRHTNVVHMIAQEYTGPLAFVQFWLDTIVQWQERTGTEVLIALGAPKDVQDAILADDRRATAVDILDLRYWWRKADGELYAPAGGQQLPGRGLESGSRQSRDSSPQQVYRKVRRYRDLYPDKAVIDALGQSRQQSWAFLMGGGSMIVAGQIEYPDKADPPDYIMPQNMDVILPTYQFIRNRLAADLPRMKPLDVVVDAPENTWCLGTRGKCYLVYALHGGSFRLDLSGDATRFKGVWLDPRSGQLRPASDGPVRGGDTRIFSAPDARDWALWLQAADD